VAAAKATAAALAAKLAVETQAAAMQHASRKQRELYVGNLAVGVVTALMLTELFNGALAAVQLGGQGAAVVKVDLDSTGKFGFVQLASEDLATAALALDKVVLCGRALNVGRPKGYVEPNTTAAAQFARAGLLPGAAAHMVAPGAAAALGAQAMQQAMSGSVVGHLTCVLLHNIVPCDTLVPDSPEREDILADCRQECAKFGPVLDVVAPPPPPEAVAAKAPGRVYVKFADAAGASACASGLNGRAFDGNRIATVLVSDDEFSSASQGVWSAAR
jgi:splicing factor U2AF subunit